MKGFLKRDLYLLSTNLRFYVFFLGAMGCLSIFMEGRTLFLFGLYLVTLCCSAILGLFNFDEVNHWQAYGAAMPDGRRRQVEGRYATALLLGGVQVVLLFLVFLLSKEENVSQVLLYFGVYLIYIDVGLPVSYRVGSSGRTVAIVLIAAVLGVVGAIVGISGAAGTGSLAAGVNVILPIVGLIMLPASRGISLNIMDQKVL